VKAWRVRQYGAPGDVLQLDDVDEPEPGDGEVGRSVVRLS
jgi:NADPH:quinone reductase-like Zn-dependent oxidoreductase